MIKNTVRPDGELVVWEWSTITEILMKPFYPPILQYSYLCVITRVMVLPFRCDSHPSKRSTLHHSHRPPTGKHNNQPAAFLFCSHLLPLRLRPFHLLLHNDSSETIADPYFDVRLGLHQEYKRVLERFKDYLVTMKSSKSRLIEKVICDRGTL